MADQPDMTTCFCWRYPCTWQCAPISPIVRWHTQDTYSPVTEEALNAVSTLRLKQLAAPKYDFKFGVIDPHHKPLCMMYDFYEPVSPISEAALEVQSSERLNKLAAPKKLNPHFKPNRPHHVYGCGRPSVIIPHKIQSTVEHDLSDRIKKMAEPLQCHPEYVGPREVPWVISRGALKGGHFPSSLIDFLAEPVRPEEVAANQAKFYRNRWMFNAGRPSLIWEVSHAAKTLPHPSERTLELYTFRETEPGFQLIRPPQWEVSAAALKAQASERIIELATPGKRQRTENLQINPDAYKVKESAKRAVASSRVCELAEPINRDYSDLSTS